MESGLRKLLKNSVLAHRGWFNEDFMQNSKAALERGLLADFGIETDVRDLDGELVISHDPPLTKDDPPSLEWLLNVLEKRPERSRVALNIKSDGHAERIRSLVSERSLVKHQIYFFDMSIPDMQDYIRRGLPVYARLSEYEQDSTIINSVCGCWVDSFSGDFDQIKAAEEVISQGRRACIVSPELHGREPGHIWQRIAETKLISSELFEICTDFPETVYDCLKDD